MELCAGTMSWRRAAMHSDFAQEVKVGKRNSSSTISSMSVGIFFTLDQAELAVSNHVPICMIS